MSNNKFEKENKAWAEKEMARVALVRELKALERIKKNNALIIRRKEWARERVISRRRTAMEMAEFRPLTELKYAEAEINLRKKEEKVGICDNVDVYFQELLDACEHREVSVSMGSIDLTKKFWACLNAVQNQKGYPYRKVVLAKGMIWEIRYIRIGYLLLAGEFLPYFPHLMDHR